MNLSLVPLETKNIFDAYCLFFSQTFQSFSSVSDIKDLSDSSYVESLREKVYASLEIYCKTKYPEQPGRFAKLLLRLPALRSIGLKCLEHLFFFKLLGNAQIEDFLIDKLTGDKNNHSSSNRQMSNEFASTSASPF